MQIEYFLFLSKFQVVTKVVIMFLVHWGYALGCFAVIWLVWLYVGTANPAVKPGRTAEFKFLMWLKNVFLQMMGCVYWNKLTKDNSTTDTKFIELSYQFVHYRNL